MVWPALRSGCALETSSNAGRREMVVRDRTRLIRPLCLLNTNPPYDFCAGDYDSAAC